MKISLIQQTASEDKPANLEKALDSVDRTADQAANIVCFSELAFTRFYPQEKATSDIVSLAETIPGPTTELFAEKARRHGIVIILNLLEESDGQTFDSSPVLNVDGSILGITRMVHITDYACFHEKGYYTPGDQGAPVYDTQFGRLGVAICYDRHYPEYMRALALKGAEIVFIPQAGAVGEWPDGLYEAEMRVASFQNGYFTALCNRVGREQKLNFAGESFVTDPSGNIIARAASQEEEILTCEIDLAKVHSSHATQLFLRDRRPELYHEWFAK